MCSISSFYQRFVLNFIKYHHHRIISSHFITSSHHFITFYHIIASLHHGFVLISHKFHHNRIISSHFRSRICANFSKSHHLAHILELGSVEFYQISSFCTKLRPIFIIFYPKIATDFTFTSNFTCKSHFPPI